MSATQELPHSYIKIGTRYRKDLGDLSSLADSIRSVGLIQRIVVDRDHNLIVGHRRFEAWKIANPDRPVPCVVVEDFDDAAVRLEAERDENTCRKDMAASELHALGAQLEKIEAPKARARQGRRVDLIPETSEPTGTEVSGGRTAEKVAEAVGLSASSWRRLKRIGDAASAGDPKAKALLAEVDAGEKSVSAADLEFTGLIERERSRLRARRESERGDIGAVGDRRALPKGKSATFMLNKVCEQLDGIAHAIGTIDLAEAEPAEAPAIAENLSQFRTVLSKTINSLRSIT